MIALIVAGLVLVVVGGNSYSNYLKAQYEREYGVLEKHRKPVAANPAGPVTGVSQPVAANTVASTLDPVGSLPAMEQGQGTPAASAGQPPATQAQAAYRTDSSVRGQASAPVPVADPEIARLQERLRAVEQESMLYQQKMKQSLGGGAAPVANPSESASLREVMNQEGGAAGASPALFPQGASAAGGQAGARSEFERQIVNAPVAGKVVTFNPDWGFVEFDASKNSNIAAGTKFAVRRGTSIVGYVKVKEVNDKTVIAELTSNNKFSETARKPKPGDDIIAWSFFEEVRR